MPAMHEIDYKIFGDDMQYVEIELDPNEATVAEAGGMMYMDDGIEMETIFGDGSKQQQGGFIGALMGAGKRLLTGESLFMTVFLNKGAGKRKIAFGAPYPCKIIPVHLAEIGGVAEEAGFDRIGVADHLWQHPIMGGPEAHEPECYATLAFLAANTDRVGLTAMVSAPAFRSMAMSVPQGGVIGG